MPAQRVRPLPEPRLCEDCSDEVQVRRIRCPRCRRLVCPWCWGHVHGVGHPEEADHVH